MFVFSLKFYAFWWRPLRGPIWIYSYIVFLKKKSILSLPDMADVEDLISWPNFVEPTIQKFHEINISTAYCTTNAVLKSQNFFIYTFFLKKLHEIKFFTTLSAIFHEYFPFSHTVEITEFLLPPPRFCCKNSVKSTIY